MMPRALPVVELVSGMARLDNQPRPGYPVVWLITSPVALAHNTRVAVARTPYTGVTLSEIPAQGMGMIRVAMRGRPPKPTVYVVQ